MNTRASRLDSIPYLHNLLFILTICTEYTDAMNQVIVDLFIPADEYLALYRGTAREVVCRSRDGLIIRFPANILQPYVCHEGIRGTFSIAFDHNKKFQSIRLLNK